MLAKLDKLLKQRAYVEDLLKNHNCEKYIRERLAEFDRRIEYIKRRVRCSGEDGSGREKQ